MKGPVAFCPLMSCGNNCNNRCLTINQMSLRCGFPKYVPQVQISQQAVRPSSRPGVFGCRVRPGLGSLPVDVSVTLWEGPGAQLSPVFLVRNSSSPEHRRDEKQGRKERRWEAGRWSLTDSETLLRVINIPHIPDVGAPPPTIFKFLEGRVYLLHLDCPPCFVGCWTLRCVQDMLADFNF